MPSFAPVMLRPMQKQSTDGSYRSADETINYLDERIKALLIEIQEQEYWKVIADPNSDPQFVQATMREIYLEIYSYQPHVIEATINAIAQMPRALDERKFKAMLLHQAEEFSHGEMAMRDYVALGGDEEYARHRRISPASFAVAGMWLMLAHMRDPFAYLGGLYIFEGLTPIITGMVKSHLTGKGMTESSLEFIEFHSTEDIRHTNLVRQLLKDVIEAFPEAADSIPYGLDCFLHVYPLPVWQTAYQRAKAEFA